MNCTVTLQLQKPNGGPLGGITVSAFVRETSLLVTEVSDAQGLVSFSVDANSHVRFSCNQSNDLNGVTVRTPKNSTFFLGTFIADLKDLKAYRVILTQTGTEAPVVLTTLENTLGGEVVWTRDVAGSYLGTLAGAFPLDKTYIEPGNVDIGAQVGDEWSLQVYSNANSNQIVLNLRNSADELLDGLGRGYVSILVYP